MTPSSARQLLQNSPGSPVRIKICGLTNPADTAQAITAGADALGFNFFPGSKRYIDPNRERAWLTAVPDHLLRVAVVVDPTREEAVSLLAEPFVDALQLHGDETPGFCQELLADQPKPVIKALRIHDASSVEQFQRYAFLPILLDAGVPGEYGGTGRTFDWSLLASFPAARRQEMILSGGLNPENVGAAMRFTKMRILDVASGVEINPREKCVKKMTSFVANARNIVI